MQRSVKAIENSRMRLAKGFFLPLIAAEMRSKFCRPASGRLGAEVLRDAFCQYKFMFHPITHPRAHSTTRLSFILSPTQLLIHSFNSLSN